MSAIQTIGFITPPAWFEPAVAEFPIVVEETVRVQQAPLLFPDFDFSLESIASTVKQSHLCARSLAAMSCDLIAQVGTPFAWAGTHSEAEARQRCDNLQQVANRPCVMTGLAIIDALRALGINNVAVNCPYYEDEGRDQFIHFLNNADINVLQALNLHDLELIKPNEKLSDYWSMSEQLTIQSFIAVAEKCPESEALIVPGTAVQTLPILSKIEQVINKPVIAADTIIHWAIASRLGLTLKPVMGVMSQLDYHPLSQ